MYLFTTLSNKINFDQSAHKPILVSIYNRYFFFRR